MENKSENEIEGDELDLDEEESSMTFLDHLEELRWVIAKSPRLLSSDASWWRSAFFKCMIS